MVHSQPFIQVLTQVSTQSYILKLFVHYLDFYSYYLTALTYFQSKVIRWFIFCSVLLRNVTQQVVFIVSKRGFFRVVQSNINQQQQAKGCGVVVDGNGKKHDIICHTHILFVSSLPMHTVIMVSCIQLSFVSDDSIRIQLEKDQVPII